LTLAVIGIAGAVTVSAWLIPLIVVGAFLALAYNLELFGGRFHTDLWFAVSWGGFPAFTGWFVEALNVRVEAVLVALACCLLSAAQRRLSTPARVLRRQNVSLAGRQRLRDGRVLELDGERVLAPLEGALSVLWKAMPILGVALVLRRL
jgi:membrane-associated PAP2 superfamily phosphatase